MPPSASQRAELRNSERRAQAVVQCPSTTMSEKDIIEPTREIESSPITRVTPTAPITPRMAAGRITPKLSDGDEALVGQRKPDYEARSDQKYLVLQGYCRSPVSFIPVMSFSPSRIGNCPAAIQKSCPVSS